MKKNKHSTQNIALYISFVLIILSMCMCICTIFSAGLIYQNGNSKLSSLVENSNSIDNYTISSDSYWRFEGFGTSKSEELWADIKTEAKVDSDEYRGDIHFDSSDYESFVEMYSNGRRTVAKIEYEDRYLNRDWFEVGDYYDYNRYNSDFDRNEDEIFANSIDFNAILSAVEDNSEDECKKEILKNNVCHIKIEDEKDFVVDTFGVLMKTNEMDEFISKNMISDVGNIWAAIETQNGKIVKLKIYFDDVEIDIEEEKGTITGGVTYHITDIDNTDVDAPRNFNSIY